MREKHEPQDAFVDRLEAQIGSEVRRRNRLAEAGRWPVQSRFRLITAAVALALVSMGVGGAVVAAAYQAQDNQRRDLVAALYELQLNLAKRNLAAAAELKKATDSKVATGLATQVEAAEAYNKVLEAEAQIRSVELQLQEVRLTGREPLNAVSAPLVSGRDFVGERLRNDITVSKAALSLEQKRLQDLRTRVEIGVATMLDSAVVEVRVRELESGLAATERKIQIRQRFLSGGITGAQADLMVLEAEAEQRLLALKPKLDLARRQLEQIGNRVKIGGAQQIEYAEARLKLETLETDLAKAELELALVRQKLSGK